MRDPAAQTTAEKKVNTHEFFEQRTVSMHIVVTVVEI